MKVICDKCEYEYDIGGKGEYKNTYGTRCPNCKNLIKPDQEPKFVQEAKDKISKMQSLYLPQIKKRLLKEVEDKKCQ